MARYRVKGNSASIVDVLLALNYQRYQTDTFEPQIARSICVFRLLRWFSLNAVYY